MNISLTNYKLPEGNPAQWKGTQTRYFYTKLIQEKVIEFSQHDLISNKLIKNISQVLNSPNKHVINQHLGSGNCPKLLIEK